MTAVLEAPMHARALHHDTIEVSWQLALHSSMTQVMHEHVIVSDVCGTEGNSACLRTAS